MDGTVATPFPGAHFGQAIALHLDARPSPRRLVLAVGAPKNNLDSPLPPLPPTEVTRSGCVFLFCLDLVEDLSQRSWHALGQLTTSPRSANTELGVSVSIMNDPARPNGYFVVAGAPAASPDAGAAWIFHVITHETINRPTLEVLRRTNLGATLPPEFSAAAAFGSSVAADSQFVVVGSPKDTRLGGLNSVSGFGGADAGSTAVFRQQSDAWQFHAFLPARISTPGARFGHAVALDSTADSHPNLVIASRPTQDSIPAFLEVHRM